MSFNGKITQEALSEVLKYLKKNPGMVKFEMGGDYPYFIEDPSEGDINAVGSVDYSTDIFSNTPVNLNQGNYFPIELQSIPTTPSEQFQPFTLPSTDPNDGGYPEYRRDKWDRRQDRQARREGRAEDRDNPQPGIDSQGRLRFEQIDDSPSRFERKSDRIEDRRDRQYLRRYNTEDKIEEGYKSGDLTMGQADDLHEGNFSGIGGRRINPKRAERKANRQDRRGDSSRADNLNATANLVGSIRGAVGDLFGAVRGGASLYAANKRNRYVEDWYRKQMQKDRTQYTPISQTQNANYLGGEGYGELGGDMGGSLAMYLNGGGGDESKKMERRRRPGFMLRPNKYGDENWFDQEDPDRESRVSAFAESAGVDPDEVYTKEFTMRRNHRESARLARKINKRIRNDEPGYEDFKRLKLNAFKYQGDLSEVSFEGGGLMDYEGGGSTHFQEGKYIEFEYGGKMHKGIVAKNENGKIYLK